jgi:N-terminal acetyltransferase B complex catalytic subunit
MVSITPFKCGDLLRFNEVNVDPLTETYGIGFYMSYMVRWPEYFLKAENHDDDLVGYSKKSPIN